MMSTAWRLTISIASCFLTCADTAKACSSGSAQGAPEAVYLPILAPTSQARAAMDALAVCYAGELTLWGIEIAIIVPGAYSKGTGHFAHAAMPDDKAVRAEYEEGAYKGYHQRILDGHVLVEPKDSDPEDVARAIVDVVASRTERGPSVCTLARKLIAVIWSIRSLIFEGFPCCQRGMNRA